MNPNTGEEVSITFGTAVDDSSWVGVGMEGGYRDITVNLLSVCPRGRPHPSSLPLQQQEIAWEGKTCRMRPLQRPWASLCSVISSRERTGTETSWSVHSLVAEAHAGAATSYQQGKFMIQIISRGLFRPYLPFRGLFLQLFRLICVDWNTAEHLSHVCRWLMSAVWVISAASQTLMNTNICTCRTEQTSAPYTRLHIQKIRHVCMIALLHIKLLFLAHLQSVEPHFLGSCVQYLYLYSVMTKVRRFAH